MTHTDVNRRDFLKAVGMGTAAAAVAAPPLFAREKTPPDKSVLRVDPEPRFDLSPYLYMQFMEPLGVTDGSVDAAWDFRGDRWRGDVIEITRELAPTLMRWGGCFCSYYRWKEGVGPMSERRPMLNQLWGGIYNNQVGTHEFVDFCRRVGADPLITVNFECDGRKFWMKTPRGGSRLGNAREAGEWVDYCNNPSNALRRKHGVKEPYGVKLWQIGNETSYGRDGFSVETAARKTIEFARAMRKADPSIHIIGWGDAAWAEKMYDIAGEHLQYLAFHNGFGAGGKGSPLHGVEYRKDPDKTWEYLQTACQDQQRTIDEMRQKIGKRKTRLAMTECHFFLAGRNRCEVLSSWAAGVANARALNVNERNGDLLKISTLADFCGTRWQNNAVMIPVPRGKSFMMPVAMIMSLYRKHVGTKGVDMITTPEGLDVAASRDGGHVFLHVVNTRRTRAVPAKLQVQGEKVAGGKVFWFDPDPEFEIFRYHPECTFPRKGDLKERTPDGSWAWTFPAASVSAVELRLESRMK